MSTASLGLALLTGLLSSLGACAVPRMLVVLSLAIEDMRGLCVYGLGLGSAYVLLALGMTFVQRLMALSTVLIEGMALFFLLIGLQGLLKLRLHSTHAKVPVSSPSIFLLGFSSACILSPCCSPILMGLAIGSPSASVLSNALLLLSFALGQNLPIAVVGYFYRKIPRYRMPAPFGEAIHILSAALCVATGAYYALLIV